jgi:hypothetical protein
MREEPVDTAALALALALQGQAAGPPPADCAVAALAESDAVPQRPHLLDKYRLRPTCPVAGVGYKVGPRNAVALQDPNDVAWPQGIEYDAKNAVVMCRQGADIHIANVDFSLHGGVRVEDTGCEGLTLTNVKFKLQPGACAIPVLVHKDARDFTISHSEIDGGQFNCSHVGELLEILAAGKIVVSYNWIHDAPQHFITIGSERNLPITAEVSHNLEERCGFFQGNHCNGLQIIGGKFSHNVITDNTIISEQPSLALSRDGKGLPVGTFDPASGEVRDIQYADGSKADLLSVRAGESIVSDCAPKGAQIKAVRFSPFSIQLTGSSIRNARCAFDIPNAYPSGMVQPINYATALGGTTDGAVISNNLIVATGPIKTVSYLISCGVGYRAAEDSNQDTVVQNNYLDKEGAFGAVYPGRTACRSEDRRFGRFVWHDNVDMKTGEMSPGARPYP